jgi:hypothetical protein
VRRALGWLRQRYLNLRGYREVVYLTPGGFVKVQFPKAWELRLFERFMHHQTRPDREWTPWGKAS